MPTLKSTKIEVLGLISPSRLMSRPSKHTNIFKNLRPKFRDNVLYGSLRNVKDPRTVVVSVVRNEVTEKSV